MERGPARTYLGFTPGEALYPLLLVAAAVAVLLTPSTRVTGSRALLVGSVTVAGAALLWRRRRPLTVLLVVGAALLAPGLLGSYAELASAVFMLVLAVFSCGRYAPRPRGYLGVPMGVAIALAGSTVDPGETLASSWTWALNAVWIFGVGMWLSQAHELVERARSESLSASRAEIAEERLRIARDLHDVLAHSLSVMVVQAEVADELLDRDPQGARRAIAQVQRTGRGAMTETRKALGLVRGVTDRPRELADLPSLVETYRSAGLPVTLDAGPPPMAPTTPVPQQTADAVFRLVEEALTNALRHSGRRPTTVCLRNVDARLEVLVANDGDVVKNGATGHGLTGMRERIEACGGRLEAGPRDGGGFAVRATVPLTAGAP